MIIKGKNFDVPSDEEKAYSIWDVINDYSNDLQGFYSSDFDPQILDGLNFEILPKSQMVNKRHLICISSSLSIDLPTLYHHLIELGINKEFIDKRLPNDEERSFKTVWV